jgi:hypothetical protein
MTWAHVLIVVGAMGLVVVCGTSMTCNSHIEGILQLATTIVGGAIGHASHAAVTKNRIRWGRITKRRKSS